MVNLGAIINKLRDESQDAFDEQTIPQDYMVERGIIDVEACFMIDGRPVLNWRQQLKRIRENGVVWDLGCGNGKLLTETRQIRPDLKLYGIGAYPYHQSDNQDFTFVRANIAHPEKIHRITHTSPDLIFSAFSLMYTRYHPGLFMINALNVVRPNGVLILDDLPINNFDPPVQEMIGVSRMLQRIIDQGGSVTTCFNSISKGFYKQAIILQLPEQKFLLSYRLNVLGDYLQVEFE